MREIGQQGNIGKKEAHQMHSKQHADRNAGIDIRLEIHFTVLSIHTRVCGYMQPGKRDRTTRKT